MVFASTHPKTKKSPQSILRSGEERLWGFSNTAFIEPREIHASPTAAAGRFSHLSIILITILIIIMIIISMMIRVICTSKERYALTQLHFSHCRATEFAANLKVHASKLQTWQTYKS